MRLLDTETGQFVDKDPEDGETVYAILSHTWDTGGEQTYEQLKKVQQRYQPRPQNLRSHPNAAETVGATSPKLVGALPTALGRLTEFEVEALLRLVAETFGLAIPDPAPSPNDAFVPDLQLAKSSPQSIWDDPELSPKIRDACRIAREHGYRYIWIDSCCIDKSSSAELSEAINSMYKWYALAAVCYAYLVDVPPGEDHHAEGSAFRGSRWFHRGWTLQELIAPGSVEFLSQDWAPIDSKHGLVNLVESITSIEYKALLHIEPLDVFSVAQRLSWAARRETTRQEDQAYSLLGIFDIQMPTLYGEGERAFRRLQEQIMQRIPDQSLFAWGLPDMNPRLFLDPERSIIPEALDVELWSDPSLRHLFALSPHFLWGCEGITTSRPDTSVGFPSSQRHKMAYTSTPYGIRTQFEMVPLTRDMLLRVLLSRRDRDVQLSISPSKPEYIESELNAQWYLALLACQHRGREGCRFGRVCYITPSAEESDVELLSAGSVYIPSQPVRVGDSFGLDGFYNLFLLPPEVIELLRSQTELKTVYIPHPDFTIPLATSSLRQQLYGAIRLVLLTETRDALSSRRGYSTRVDPCGPDAEHPTAHRLTLSKDEHTITVEFQHDLQDDGMRLTVDATVQIMMSVPSPDAQLESASPLLNNVNAVGEADALSPSRCTVSWADPEPSRTRSLMRDSVLTMPWAAKLGDRRVVLSVPGARPHTVYVELGLDFAGGGYYFLRVDVLSTEQPPASLVVEEDVDSVGQGARTEEVSAISG